MDRYAESERAKNIRAGLVACVVENCAPFGDPNRQVRQPSDYFEPRPDPFDFMPPEEVAHRMRLIADAGAKGLIKPKPPI